MNTLLNSNTPGTAVCLRSTLSCQPLLAHNWAHLSATIASSPGQFILHKKQAVTLSSRSAHSAKERAPDQPPGPEHTQVPLRVKGRSPTSGQAGLSVMGHSRTQ